MMASTIRKQTLLSIVINVTLSGAFFLVVFGLPIRDLSFGAPDHFARDLLPQAGMIGLMSAMAPLLAIRSDLNKLGASVPSIRAIVILSIIMAIICLAIASLIILACHMADLRTIDGPRALALKLAFGGALGLCITPRAIRRLF